MRRITRLTKSELHDAFVQNASQEAVDNAYFGLSVLLNEMEAATNSYYRGRVHCSDIIDGDAANIQGECKFPHSYIAATSYAPDENAVCSCSWKNNERPPETIVLPALDAKANGFSRCIDGKDYRTDPYISDTLFPDTEVRHITFNDEPENRWPGSDLADLERHGNRGWKIVPNSKVVAFRAALTERDKVKHLNRVLQEIHGRGPVADLFVNGGVKTLNELSGLTLKDYVDDLIKTNTETALGMHFVSTLREPVLWNGVLDYSPEEISALPLELREVLERRFSQQELYHRI